MGVRAALPFLVEDSARVLHEGGRLTQLAVRSDGDDADAAAGIVRHQHMLAGFIGGYVTRAGAAGALLVEPRQFAGLLVNGECRHRAGTFPFEIGDFIDGKEELVVRRDCQKRRIDRGAGRHCAG